MAMGTLLVFDPSGVEPVINSPFFAGVVDGDPQTQTLRLYGGRDVGTSSGIWRATKGTFRMDYQVWEFCHLVSGRCVVTPEGRSAVTFGPGDSFICEKGLKGTWQILEEMTKHFVINF